MLVRKCKGKKTDKGEPFTEANEYTPVENEEAPSVQIVYVYSNGCSYCTKFTPKFKDVVPMFVELRPKSNIVVDKVEVGDASENIMQMVTSFPTVLVFLNGVYFKQLNGDQDSNAIMDFLMTIPTSD